MACAMASRCFMPWLYVLDLAGGPRRRARRSPAPRRSARPPRGRPVARQYSLQVLQAGQVRQEARPLDQRAEPGQHRRAGHEPVPEDEISPWVGWVRPISTRSVVVLPAPFGPSRPTHLARAGR